MRLATLAICLLLAGNNLAQDKTVLRTITLEPFKTVSYGAFFKSLTLSSPDCGVEFLSDLDFEWGYYYKVQVKEITLAQPPEDGSSIEYELVKVISKEKVPEDFTFNMLLEGTVYLGNDPEEPGSLQLVDEHTYRYLDEVNFHFDASQAAALNRIAKGGRARAVFRVSGPNELTLISL